MRDQKMAISGLIDPTVADFDPAKPDALDKFTLPHTPIQPKQALVRPAGN